MRSAIASAIALVIALAALALTALCAAAPAQAARDELRQIVQQRCLPDWLQRHDPAPCLQVALTGTAAMASDGYALLADRKGGAHVLLIPLRTLSGIESAALLQPRAPNYFAAAWDARGQISRRSMPPVPRLRADQIALAVNSRYSRGQDQLHIHIECQGRALHEALRIQARQLGAAWRPIDVDGSAYMARRVMGGTLAHANPFKLLSEQLPGAHAHMGLYTLIVAQVQFRDGPGFALLTRRAFLRGGEALLDSTCAIARR